MQLNSGAMRPTGDVITDRLDTGPLQLPHLGQLLLNETGHMSDGNLTRLGLENLQACAVLPKLNFSPHLC